MTVRPKTAYWCLLTLAFLATSIASQRARAQSADEDAPPVVVVTDDAPDTAAEQFAVPDGSAAELLAFIEQLAQPQRQFTSNEEIKAYFDQASAAIGAAADKILAGDATDQQTIDAIEWKVESLRIRGKLGDEEAEQKNVEFLENPQFSQRPAIAEAVANIRRHQAEIKLQTELVAKLRDWPRLSESQRAETSSWLVTAVKEGGTSANHVVMLIQFCDMLAETPDAALALEAVDELMPLFRANADPAVAARLPLLEGLARRLNLTGNEIELAGTLLDGTPLDWESYRGKVVLVDYWATWCAPCRAELPNVLDNYRKYHDKGFEVLGVCLDDDRGQAEQFLAETKLPWPSLFHEGSDESGWQHPMAVKYGITGIPMAILIDQQGKVVTLQARGPRLSAALRQLLGEPVAAATSEAQSSEERKTAQSNGR